MHTELGCVGSKKEIFINIVSACGTLIYIKDDQ